MNDIDEIVLPNDESTSINEDVYYYINNKEYIGELLEIFYNDEKFIIIMNGDRNDLINTLNDKNVFVVEFELPELKFIKSFGFVNYKNAKKFFKEKI